MIAGPGIRRMSVVLWLKVLLKRIARKEVLTADSTILVRENRGKLVPLAWAYMARLDKVDAVRLRCTAGVEGSPLRLSGAAYT